MRRRAAAFDEPQRIASENITSASKRASKRPACYTCASAKIARLLARAESAVQQETNAKRFFVSGIVQGVGFRSYVERTARRLKLAGYVRNLRDGRVEAYAIGEAEALSSLRMTLERGPNSASVTGVSEEPAEIEMRFAADFSIEYDE